VTIRDGGGREVDGDPAVADHQSCPAGARVGLFGKRRASRSPIAGWRSDFGVLALESEPVDPRL
jgi:hypothetical protein